MSRALAAATISQMTARSKVLIAGGGVAALEALLTFHELATDRVETLLMAPESHFWYRPLAVAEPFELGDVQSFDLAKIAEDLAAEFIFGELVAVDADERIAVTAAGVEIGFDALLLACGAVPRPTLPDVLTFRGPADTERISSLLGELYEHKVRSVAVTLPIGGYWSLPAYELALLLARYCESAHLNDVELSLVTPEDEPLLLFGEAARDEISRLLAEHSIELHTGVHAVDYRDRMLRLFPHGLITVDRVIALPRLYGPPIDGIPQTRDGFVPVDQFGRVRGFWDVFAAGDITTFPVKQGGIATQQADAAAETIAAAAGVAIDPAPFRPVLRGLLLTGAEPRYLRRDAGKGLPGVAGIDPLWWPPAKIVGHRLAPFLAARVGEGEPAEADGSAGIRVEVHLSPEERPPEPAAMPVAEDEPAVEELMSTEFVSVAPEDTLGELAEKLRAKETGAAMVVDFGRLVGIVTSRDLLRAFGARVHSSEARVREWMTAEPIVARTTTSVSAAFALMDAHAIHHLPVVEDERPVGVVGLRQIARAVERLRAPGRVGLGF
jgi:sulfide:quinone oxidoreductase